MYFIWHPFTMLWQDKGLSSSDCVTWWHALWRASTLTWWSKVSWCLRAQNDVKTRFMPDNQLLQNIALNQQKVLLKLSLITALNIKKSPYPLLPPWNFLLRVSLRDTSTDFARYCHALVPNPSPKPSPNPQAKPKPTQIPKEPEGLGLSWLYKVVGHPNSRLHPPTP